MEKTSTGATLQPSFDSTDVQTPLLPYSNDSKSHPSSLKEIPGRLYKKLFPAKGDEANSELGLHPPYEEKQNCSIIFKAVLALTVYFGVGVFCFYLVEDDLSGYKTSNKFIDALYFSVVTFTTVGYGDLVPGSIGGKIFTCGYVFLGFLVVGALVSSAANYLVEKQEKIVVHSIKKIEVKGYEHLEYERVRDATWKVYLTGFMVIFFSAVGFGFLLLVEKMSFTDAFYCVCVTVTTLGYGDHTFQTPTGRLFAALWLICSTASVAQLFLYVAEMRTQNRQLQLARWVLHRKTTRCDLEAADLDRDGVVRASEFVIFKLKELGTIDDEKISGILEEFHALNYDSSGFISTRDPQFE